jgi:thiol-disulfide isomerase/thioredoxin
MKVVYFFLIIILSLFIMLAISPLRGAPLGMAYSSSAGFILYFLFTIFSLKFFKSKLSALQILLAVIVGFWLLLLPIRIIDFESSVGSLPDSLLQTLGIICGFLYRRLKKPFNILTAFLGCLILTFMLFRGYDFWFHKLNFGTFTGRIEAHALPSAFEASDENNDVITDVDFKGKIVLLDFWYTQCGPCFDKFPQLQAAYDRYKNDPSIVIYAVDNPVEEDKPGQAFEEIKNEGFSFPVVIAKDENMPENFGVKVYPTTFVIDRNGMIVYKGAIAGAVKMVEELKEPN